MQAGSKAKAKVKAEQKRKRPAAGEIVLKAWKHAKRESEPKRWSRKGERTQRGETPTLKDLCSFQGARRKGETRVHEKAKT